MDAYSHKQEIWSSKLQRIAKGKRSEQTSHYMTSSANPCLIDLWYFICLFWSSSVDIDDDDDDDDDEGDDTKPTIECMANVGMLKVEIAVTFYSRRSFDQFIAGKKTGEIEYTNDILAMVSPESEKVSLGKVNK